MAGSDLERRNGPGRSEARKALEEEDDGELDFERHEMAELGARVNAASILPAAQL